MPAVIAAAFPFVEVRIDTSALVPIAQRSPGVIAVVGNSSLGAAAVDVPMVVSTLDDAANFFATKNPNGTVTTSPLYDSLKLAMLQDPVPSKIYGVKVSNSAYAAGLASLEGVDDVDFVSLANESTVGAAAGGGNPATGLMALKDHVESMSAQGQKRLGVAMINNATAKSPTYVATTIAAVTLLQSSVSRMVVVAARGSTQDVATAAMGAIAGYEPQVSMVLKPVRGLSALPLEAQFTPSEIKGLSEAGVIPVIVPSLIPGGGLHFAEARTFTTDASMPYIDIVRVLDDIDFRLKAGLIGLIGDARITKQGMIRLQARIGQILGPLVLGGVITDFSTKIPLLNILNVPETAWTDTDRAIVTTARANRSVDVLVTITYGPATHHLKVTLAPSF
jgi:hypothetical protein